MKKILFAAMALGMTMTSCMNDEFPNATRYGYINLNVSNDPVMQTRGTQTVSDLSSWTITTLKDGESTSTTWSATTAYVAGQYTVSAQNYADENAWKTANGNWGDAFYQGETEVSVTPGVASPAEIQCGTAKNAKITVTISDQLPNSFTDVKVIVKRSESINLEFPHEKYSEAFFSATETVSYSLSYKYNDVNKGTDVKTLTMAGAATNNIINVTANSNGLITVTIKYDDAFNSGNSSTITFDGATGNEATNNPTN